MEIQCSALKININHDETDITDFNTELGQVVEPRANKHN